MSETPADRETDRETRSTTERETGRGVRDRIDTEAMKWVSGIVSLIGLWIAGSPFVYETTEMALWNNVVVGLGIFLIAGYNFYRMSKDRLASVGSASLVALLGLWTIVAPFAIEFLSEALLWSNVAAGAIVAVVAAYNAYANRQAKVTHRGTRA